MGGFDAVVHVLAAVCFDGRDPAQIVDTVQTLATTASVAGTRSFVLASTTLVYAADDVADRRGHRAPCPAVPFGEAALEADHRLRRIGEVSGMAVAVLRLPHVYGRESPFFEYVDAGSIPVAGATDAVFSHLHVDDAAAALGAAARGALDGTFVLADGEAVSWEHSSTSSRLTVLASGSSGRPPTRSHGR